MSLGLYKSVGLNELKIHLIKRTIMNKRRSARLIIMPQAKAKGIPLKLLRLAQIWVVRK